MGEAEELPGWQGEGRTVSPTPQPQPQKTQAAEGKVGQTSPQEISRQADFAPSREGSGRETFTGPVDAGTRGEPLEPTPYGPSRTEAV